MEFLKKLSLNKRYINKTNKKYFLKYIVEHNLNCQVKRIKNEEVIFLTNFIIKDEQIESLDRYKYHFKYTILKHLTGILTFLCCTIILILSGDFIREIEFENPSNYRKEVYEDVASHLVKKGPFYVLDDSINNISQSLRNKYSEYAWIGLTLDNSRIIIDIQKQEVPNSDIEDLTSTGDLIAKCDAVISDILVNRGVVMIDRNQSVKKGDTLVSGNLLIQVDPNNYTKLVKSKGVIIGKTVAIEKIKVPIKTLELAYSGRIKTYKKIKIFGKLVGKNPESFENYYTKIESLFKFFKILELVEIKYYEQVEITKIHDQSSVITFAESQVRKAFEQQRTSELERIDNIELLDVVKEEQFFVIRLIVKKYENIVLFKQH